MKKGLRHRDLPLAAMPKATQRQPRPAAALPSSLSKT